MIRLLHIGLGKCGSTFLQEQVFPKISKKLNINYINLYNNNFIKIDNSKIKFHAFENLQNSEALLPNNFIISHESLFSYRWEFSRIEKSFNFLKKNFSKNITILIVIRNPYELLNSIYCQAVQDMKIINPENFFYHKQFEENIRANDKFNLYNFNYDFLISLYKSYFKKVVVIKYENLQNFSYLKEIFNVDDNFLKKINISNKVYNKSISKFGINSILFLNKFFNLKKYDQFIRSYVSSSSRILHKIKNRILSEFLLRNIFQSKIDKIFPYKKYYIKKEFIPIDIDSEISKYEKLNF